MIRVLFFQLIKELVHGIFETLIILSSFRSIDHFQQGGEVLFTFWSFIPDVSNQSRVIETFRFDPEIFTSFFTFPLGVDDDGVD